MRCCALQVQEINIDLFSEVLGQLSLFFFVFILGMCFVKSFQLFGLNSSRRILSHMKVTKRIGESIDVVLQYTVYNPMLSI